MSKKLSMIFALLGVVGLGVLGAPSLGNAHSHFSLGIGPGWWGPWYGWGWYPPYPYPAPVVMPPPCSTVWVNGHWGRAARTDSQGFTTYIRTWVPGRWERMCP